MNRTLIAGAIAAVAVFAGVVYFAGGDRNQVPVKAEAEKRPAVEAPMSAARVPPPVARSEKASRPAVRDPRLAALMVSPQDALIDFYVDPDGRVIREIDNDPASQGYRKPLRDYTYAGDKVIRLVAYHYLGSQVQVVTADVTYKPDGSVDQFNESTRYQ